MSSVDRPPEGVEAPGFELPNVGVGPDPLSLAHLESEVDFAVLIMLRDYHCPKCKQQVSTLAEQARAFAERNAVVVPVLPESVERTREWAGDADLPFPLLADPGKEVGEKYDQPVRFGALGRLHDVVGRMPQAVVLDTRGESAEAVHTFEGDTPGDRPDVETLLDAVGDLQETFVFDCSLVDC